MNQTVFVSLKDILIHCNDVRRSIFNACCVSIVFRRSHLVPRPLLPPRRCSRDVMLIANTITATRTTKTTWITSPTATMATSPVMVVVVTLTLTLIHCPTTVARLTTATTISTSRSSTLGKFVRCLSVCVCGWCHQQRPPIRSI